MSAPLNAKLNSVKWGEFRLGDLFEIKHTMSLNTESLIKGDEYDYVTRTSLNQGILQTTGFINERSVNESCTWSLGLLQMDFFYRNKPWYAGQFVRKIVPKIVIPKDCIPFITAVLNGIKNVLLKVLVRYVDETFYNIKIRLPEKQGIPDFTFMASFIRELEEERLCELSSYFKASGLESYNLTEKEQGGLNTFSSIKWSEFKIGDLFTKIKTNKLPYKAKDLPQSPENEYIIPCLTSSFMNQGLNYYAPKQGATVLKNVISIPSNSDVYRAYYQSKAFTVLSDAYAIQWKNSSQNILPSQYLFMVACINKVTDLPIYSYKNKLGGWNVVKNKEILLPINDSGHPDLDLMNNFITAIQKILIRDVVKYMNKKLGLQ